MKKKITYLLILMLMVVTTSCATYNPVETPSYAGLEINQERVDERLEIVASLSTEPAGFWRGVLHGILAPFSLIGIAFGNTDIGVYETYNTGNWYNFGFLIGCGALAGGSSSSTNSKR